MVRRLLYPLVFPTVRIAHLQHASYSRGPGQFCFSNIETYAKPRVRSYQPHFLTSSSFPCFLHRRCLWNAISELYFYFYLIFAHVSPARPALSLNLGDLGCVYHGQSLRLGRGHPLPYVVALRLADKLIRSAKCVYVRLPLIPRALHSRAPGLVYARW